MSSLTLRQILSRRPDHRFWQVEYDVDWDKPLDEAEPQAPVQGNRAFFTISELADRWQCSRGTVYNRLRSAGAKVLDFARSGKRGRKVVSSDLVHNLEARHTRRL
ncbi:MAG TPA: hypothetical protein VEV41_13910 [Terriglobales bacterium]|nr:hypothetical protein [Terriglobales bacterium]